MKKAPKMKTSLSALASASLSSMVRVAYMAEVERLAIKLRPRFESGELRGFADVDEADLTSPLFKLEKLCRAHFGIRVTETKQRDGSILMDADDFTVHLVLAASPSQDETWDPGWNHPAHWAAAAAALDVLRFARANGWSRPVKGESVDKVA